MTELPDNEPEDDVVSQQEDSNIEDSSDNVETNDTESTQDEFDPKKKVEFTTPEQQRKFNDIYKQVKMSDARNKMLLDAIEKQNQVIEEIQGRFNQTDHAEAERVLTSRLREAREQGDDEKADKIQQEIIDFKVESKINKLTNNVKKPVQKFNIDELPPEGKYLYSAAIETNDNGELARPWMQDNHPRYQEALYYASQINQKYNGEVDIKTSLKELDKMMSQPKKSQSNSRSPDPMRGNLTTQTQRSKVSLSSKESEILSKLNAHLPSDKQIKPEGYMKWK